MIGPFTIKQALYLGGGAGLIFLIKLVLNGFFFVVLAVPIGAFAAALAFLKVNELPFPVVLKNALLYSFRPRFYLWRQEARKKPETTKTGEKKPETLINTLPKMSESKLSDLAWSLDIKEKGKE